MWKYVGCLKKAFYIELHYCADYIGLILGEIFTLIIQYYLLKQLDNLDFKVSIYVLFSFLLRMLFNNSIVFKINDDFKSGKIAITKTKPINYYGAIYFEELGKIFSKFIFFVPISLIIYIFCKEAIVFNMMFFLLSLILSIVLNILLEFIIGILSYFMGSSIGLYMFNESLKTIFSGLIIPLTLFPDIINNLANTLPYKYIYYYPLMLISDEKLISSSIFLKLLSSQFIYTLIIFLVFVFLSKLADTKLVIHGG